MARILFFGKLGDIAGGREKRADLPREVDTIGKLVEFLVQDDNLLASALNEGSVRVAVNEQICSRSAKIGENDEIAFLPPVSGG